MKIVVKRGIGAIKESQFLFISVSHFLRRSSTLATTDPLIFHMGIKTNFWPYWNLFFQERE